MSSSAANEPSTFMFAQAMRILAETGHAEPNRETAGLAFVAALLNAGWSTEAIANAIQAGFADAGPQLNTRSAYTLMTYEQTRTQAIVTFRRTFLESMRPGIGERSEQKAKLHMTAPPGGITNNVFSNAMGGFWGSLLLEPADDDQSRDEQLKKDLQQAIRAARTASSQARKRAKQQQAESL